MNTNHIIRSLIASSCIITGSSLAKEATQNKWAVTMDSPTPHMIGVDNSFNTWTCKIINWQRVYVVASAASMPAGDAFYTRISKKDIAKINSSPNCKK